ncbi:hypothetical protein Trco_004283 [Trichoderma cornu-damae]|uniref:Uncharacterized protein n=1 Tax=Trichoderma cornu-damae TaxID=654480 RepID=A0A9P8QKF6_9HYPO|nr:hypothetical protein Trco_004283 [Trichoderma cornu-damae]
MIESGSKTCNFGRGAYDTTGLPKPPPPQPQHAPSTNEKQRFARLNKACTRGISKITGVI